MSIMKMKWILVHDGVWTDSGQDEIVAGAQYRGQLMQLVKIMGINLKRDGYSVTKVEPEVPQKKRSEALEVGSPEHDTFVVEQVDRMAAQDVRITLDEMPEGEEKDILEEAYKNLINPYRNSKKEQ